MKPSLHIVSSGMCCPVGFSARAARAAIRGRLNQFVESEFIADRAEPLVVSRMPIADVWGPRRLAMMFEGALRDCMEQAPDFQPDAVALLLLVAEQGRPGYKKAWAKACVAAYEKITGAPLPEQSRILASGRAGLATALQQAHALLREGRLRQVVVAGVDSYLNVETINALLRKHRLLTEDSSDGFIPGEGAGVVLLSLQTPEQPGLHVLGVGAAEETASPDNDEPVRALGLTRAMREALAQSGYQLNDLDFRMTDLSGDPFYFKEAATADTRLLDHRAGRFPLMHLSDCIGETGAAIGPLSLAYLSDAMARGYVPGKRAVLHLSNDGGARAAVILEYLST